MGGPGWKIMLPFQCLIVHAKQNGMGVIHSDPVAAMLSSLFPNNLTAGQSSFLDTEIVENVLLRFCSVILAKKEEKN